MSHNSGKSVSDDATTLADSNVFMEAMVSEMRRMMKFEMEQVHERIDWMENSLDRQPQNGPNFLRRERVPRREARVEDEEPYGSGFEEEEDRDLLLAIGDRRAG
ncbi:hypothetical protein CJ030_MR8G007079 [Morella rubra]|uniref:Uncharacterized protein n=1 Tax=Morella rubra TaxID=262757 RepID=A0A6A1UNF9_9ROSI|nr:hypothetical protein CJ030_MR8G007079 [Morella rubra]